MTNIGALLPLFAGVPIIASAAAVLAEHDGNWLDSRMARLAGKFAGIVTVAIALSYGIARALSLPRRLAILIACGNSICGNSAIAATAPVIGADGVCRLSLGRHVAGRIAFVDFADVTTDPLPGFTRAPAFTF